MFYTVFCNKTKTIDMLAGIKCVKSLKHLKVEKGILKVCKSFP